MPVIALIIVRVGPVGGGGGAEDAEIRRHCLQGPVHGNQETIWTWVNLNWLTYVSLSEGVGQCPQCESVHTVQHCLGTKEKVFII